ncbi:hypothetical protein BY996DRAFT_6461584 [Phakopsora pachyrhizi]|nr:hypothetical protein BY996DRAFT_6461584 [Phakopsora pachyrhizi]
MTADVMTKPLDKIKHNKFLNMIGLFYNAGYSQGNPFEERDDGIENIQHFSDTKHQDSRITKYEVTKLNWEQQKWHLEKEQKDKEGHMELTIREKEIQFAKDWKDNELEVRMLIADKDCEAMKFRESSALFLAVV